MEMYYNMKNKLELFCKSNNLNYIYIETCEIIPNRLAYINISNINKPLY
jgi:ribosomal protein L7Ae-like RNA K-turn-binding protein